jgi:hypothetical protein
MTETNGKTIETSKDEEDVPEPKIFQVILKTGVIWQHGQHVPGSDQIGVSDETAGLLQVSRESLVGKNAITIVGMFRREDGRIDVFGKPVAGSSFDEAKQAFIMTLYPDTILNTVSLARADVWEDLLAEATEAGAEWFDREPIEPEPDDPELEPPSEKKPAEMTS